MIKLTNRLKKKRDFDLVLKHGSWINGQFFSLKVLKLNKIKDLFPKREDPEKFQKQLRIAITVGLKVSKSAVKRNTIKRQTGEVVRLLMQDPGLQNGYYLMFVAKPIVLTAEYADLSQEINFLLKKSGVLN